MALILDKKELLRLLREMTPEELTKVQQEVVALINRARLRVVKGDKPRHIFVKSPPKRDMGLGWIFLATLACQAMKTFWWIDFTGSLKDILAMMEQIVT